MPPDHLIVFVKAPQAGCVKTRLAAEIGEAAACAAYEVLVAALLEQLASLASVELRLTPDDAGAEVASWLRAGWRLQPQGRGDLGERLRRAFADAFAAGARRVVVIGSDCVAVTADDVRAAWRSLADSDLVLGPASDGGYWLAGLKQESPGLFQEIPWSTGNVFAVTLARARAAGQMVHLLRELTDVDDAACWTALLRARPELAERHRKRLFQRLA